MELKTLADRLLFAREAAGYSLRELGDAAGVSPSRVGQLEKGDSSPATDTLEALARALHVDPGWLAFGAGAKPSALSIREAVRAGGTPEAA